MININVSQVCTFYHFASFTVLPATRLRAVLVLLGKQSTTGWKGFRGPRLKRVLRLVPRPCHGYLHVGMLVSRRRRVFETRLFKKAGLSLLTQTTAQLLLGIVH